MKNSLPVLYIIITKSKYFIIMGKNFTKLYWSTIVENYDSLKKKISCWAKKNYGEPINEDVFHDTIIRCEKIYDFLENPPEEIIKYVFSAYKTNHYRDKLYARNRNINIDEVSVEAEQIEDSFDLDNALHIEQYIDILTKRYGNFLSNIFKEYIEGMKITELEEKYNMRLYIIMHEMKTYLYKEINK